MKCDADHVIIPERINSVIGIVRHPWLHPRYHFPRFNCFLGYRGLNLWDQNGKFFVNLREPVTEYHGVFPVSERTWFRHDPRWEVLESEHLRRLKICHYGFYHVRFVKVGREQDLKGYPPPDINSTKMKWNVGCSPNWCRWKNTAPITPMPMGYPTPPDLVSSPRSVPKLR